MEEAPLQTVASIPPHTLPTHPDPAQHQPYPGHRRPSLSHTYNAHNAHTHATLRAGDTSGRYAGALDCALQTASKEGPAAFYRGFVPNFVRIGAWNAAAFVVLERLRAVLSAALAA